MRSQIYIQSGLVKRSQIYIQSGLANRSQIYIQSGLAKRSQTYKNITFCLMFFHQISGAVKEWSQGINIRLEGL